MVQAVSQTSQDVKILPVAIKEGKELYFATSEALPGLLVAEPTREALYRAIPEVMKLMYKAKGLQVEVRHAEPDPAQPALDNWAVIPCRTENEAKPEASF